MGRPLPVRAGLIADFMVLPKYFSRWGRLHLGLQLKHLMLFTLQGQVLLALLDIIEVEYFPITNYRNLHLKSKASG